jgi:Wiskott-Aldrich syndrome protein
MSIKGPQAFAHNLSYKENLAIHRLLGERCKSLCSVKAQIHMNETQWVRKYSGILCIVKDNAKRSYFCRLFSLVVSKMIWEQEIHNEMKIEKIRPFLLEFEGEVKNKIEQ